MAIQINTEKWIKKAMGCDYSVIDSVDSFKLSTTANGSKVIEIVTMDRGNIYLVGMEAKNGVFK